MGTIGDTLREARIRQQIDITEVEERTKIRAKYLRALENEEFQLLPGSTFVRSFLRTYAEYLGLDPHVLLEEFRMQYEPREEIVQDVQGIGGTQPRARRRDPRREQRREPRYRPNPPRRGTVIALAAVAVVAFLLILGLTSENKSGSHQSAAEKRAAKLEAKRKAKAEQTARARAAQKRRAALLAKSRVKLRVEPPADGAGSYICVDNGPGTTPVFEQTITTPQTFKGKHLRMTIGRRQTVLRENNRKVTIAPGATAVALDFKPNQKPVEITN